MSIYSTNAPILRINSDELRNLIEYIRLQENTLQEFGALKLCLDTGCALALKRRKQNKEPSIRSEQIVKLDHHEMIYVVKEAKDSKQLNLLEESSASDEENFWSSLNENNGKERYLNTSNSPSTSLFSERQSAHHFSTRRLPAQSLLKMGGRQIVNSFTPCATRAHTCGAIFPLASNRQRLSSITYHHEGGARHWYIIPHSQREALQRIIEEHRFLLCLDHGLIFIDPTILDKHHILYYRITQNVRDIVVLGAGTLAQSFTEGAGWYESIEFALLSWITGGHVQFIDSNCLCQSQTALERKRIDPSLFANATLWQSDVTCLFRRQNRRRVVHRVNEQKATKAMEKSQTESTPDESYDDKELSVKTQPILQLRQLTHPSQLSEIVPNGTTTSDHGYGISVGQYAGDHSYRESTVRKVDSYWNDFHYTNNCLDVNSKKSDIDVDHTKQQANSFITSSLHAVPPTSDFLLFQTMISDMPTVDSILQEKMDVGFLDHEAVQFQSETLERAIDELMSEDNQHGSATMDDAGKVLFISGLQGSVQKSDIHQYFTGCTKVIMKPCQMTPNLKYAIVVHRTSQDAAHNLRRPMNQSVFGERCHIQYSRERHQSSSSRNDYDRKMIFVNHIPEGVTKKHLEQLFLGGIIRNYCPARSIYRTNSASEKNRKKILWGYAFISYQDASQAAAVIKNVGKYRINDHSLFVDFCRKNRFKFR